MKLNKIIDLFSKHGHACLCHDCESGTHSHHDHDTETAVAFKPDKLLIARLILAVLLFVVGMLSHHVFHSHVWELILMILVVLIAGYDILISAAVNLVKRHTLDEYLLMSIAAIAAFIVGESHEGAAVMLLFQIGELFQDYAIGKTRQSVSDLVNIQVDTVTVLDGAGERTMPAKDVPVGASIKIRHGEVVPMDCLVLDGQTTIDTSLLTGDGMPIRVKEGDNLCSGYYNAGEDIVAEVLAAAADSTSSRIMNMVQTGSSRRGNAEKFLTKFARIYTPVILGLAVLLAVIIPLLTELTFAESIHRALVFLVIACPCAIVISIPLAYFAGIGGASRFGILFKNSASIDTAAKASAVVLDQHGTLTTGGLRVVSVKSDQMEAELFLRIAAHAQAYSDSAVAQAIRASYDKEIYLDLIDKFVEYPDGVTVVVDGIQISLGTYSFMELRNINLGADSNDPNAIYMSVADRYAGRMILGDAIRDDIAEAVDELEFAGCEHIVVLSERDSATSEATAKAAGIEEYYAECLPLDKINHVKEVKSRLGDKGKLIFVGDNIGDIPAIDAADLGIVLGSQGSKAALNAADVVIIDDKPSKIAMAIHAARSTRFIIFQNLAFILLIKLLVLILGAFGISPLWFAVFADAGVALAAILNSMRAFKIRLPKR